MNPADPGQRALHVVANHPTGIADGIAVFDAIRARGADAVFFANADALRVSPRLGEAVIPVEWVVAKRTREKTRATLAAAKEAFEAERCVVMFPAGRLSRVAPDGSVTDPEWAPTAASLARKYAAPIVPIHVAGPNSTLFHLFDRVSKELRDITLFHELLNKKRKAFQLKVGKPIPPAARYRCGQGDLRAEGLHRTGPAQPAGRRFRMSREWMLRTPEPRPVWARHRARLAPGETVLLYARWAWASRPRARPDPGHDHARRGRASPTFTLVQF
jgi:hypothetical protein